MITLTRCADGRVFSFRKEDVRGVVKETAKEPAHLLVVALGTNELMVIPVHDTHAAIMSALGVN